MPWSGTAGSKSFTRSNGVHSGSTTWAEDAAASTAILATLHDTHDQDITDGINTALCKDGGNTATADIPMGGFTLTNIAAAGARTEPARFSDVQDNKGQYVASVGGSANAITLTPTIPITAYAAGQRFSFIAGSTNTTATTVNVSTVGAKSIVRPDGSHTALAAGDIVAASLVDIEYDGTRFQLLGWRSQADVSQDTSPELGGHLDANGFDIKFDSNTGLQDANGNEVFYTATVASAVNYLRVVNSATGNPPYIEAQGSDTNIDFQFIGKGTGGIIAAFKNATGLGILDSNASHTLFLTTTSNITANRTLTLVPGDASRTVTLSGDLTVSGNVTLPSGFTAAAQADQETATSTATFVAPGTQHYHPSAAKAWVRFNAAGTVAASYNITSITDTGAGDWTVNIGTDFSSANYCGVVNGGAATGPVPLVYNVAGTRAAGAFQINAYAENSGVRDTLTDPAAPVAIFAAFYGDHA